MVRLARDPLISGMARDRRENPEQERNKMKVRLQISLAGWSDSESVYIDLNQEQVAQLIKMLIEDRLDRLENIVARQE